MSSIEATSQFNLSIGTFQMQPEHSRHSRRSTIVYTYDQFKSAMPLALPHPRRTEPVADARPQALESARIDLVVVCQVIRFGPERPVVCSQVRDVKHVILHHIDAGRVLLQRLR